MLTFDDIMNYTKSNKANFEELVDTYHRNSSSILPFLGAGMSVEFGYPLWKDLLIKLIDNINEENRKKQLSNELNDSAADYEQIASEIEVIRRNLIYRDIREIYSDRVYQGEYKGTALDLMPELFTQIATTNYDSNIERVYAKHKISTKTAYAQNKNLVYHGISSGDVPCIYKLHGSIDAGNKDIIFTKKSYECYDDTNSALMRELSICINAKHLLFMGASLNKDRIANKLIDLGNEGNSHFAIMPCAKDKMDKELRRLSNFHVDFAILYPENQHECVRIILEELLRRTKKDVYHKVVESNQLSCSAEYLNDVTEKITNFMKPSFKIRSTLYGSENGSDINGMEELYEHISTAKEKFFYIVDGYMNNGEVNAKTVYGGGGMGKSTILSKTYLAHPSNVLLFLLKEYSSDWEDQINNKIAQGGEVWLLFDGLNEMTNDQFKEFNNMMVRIRNRTDCSQNVKFIFSARKAELLTNMNARFFTQASKQIISVNYSKKSYDEYLEERTLPDKMRKILGTPLLLAVYFETQNTLDNLVGDIDRSELFEADKDKTLLNAGEVLWDYVYSQMLKFSTSGEVEEKVKECFEMDLPHLAYEMRKQNSHTMHIEEYSNLIGEDSTIVEQKLEKISKGLNLTTYTKKPGCSTISFVHEELLDFFAALYLHFRMLRCIEEKLLYVPEEKNPTENIRRYMIEIQKGNELEQSEEKQKGKENALATINFALGDLFFYKARNKYTNRFTEGVDDKEELYQKAREYYDLQDSFGDPLGAWNRAQVNRELLKLDKDNTELKKDIYEDAVNAVKDEKEIWEDINNIDEYYKKIPEYDLHFASRMGAIQNQMGIVYSEGIGTNINLIEAKKCFREGMKNHYAYSYNRLAQAHEKVVIDNMKRIMRGEEKDLKRTMKVIEEEYVTAFVVFWLQIQTLQESYAMNRVSWYVLEGITIKLRNDEINDKNEEIFNVEEDKESGLSKVSMRLQLDWLSECFDQKLYKTIMDTQDIKKLRKFVTNQKKIKRDIEWWLEQAAFAGNTFAAERLKKLKNKQLAF